MARLSVWVLLGLALFTISVPDLRVSAEAPTEYECRPYIEKALQDLKSGETASQEQEPTDETSTQESPIDVTSQEEEDNTAAEETSIEEDVPASPEQLTPSEEVQEALFDNSAEPVTEGSQEVAPDDEDDDDEDDDDDEQADETEGEEDQKAGDEDDDAEDDEEAGDDDEADDDEEAEDDEEQQLTASEEADKEEDEDTEVTASEEAEDNNGSAEEDTGDDEDEEITESQEAAAAEDDDDDDEDEDEDEEPTTESQEALTASEEAAEEEDDEEDDEDTITESQETLNVSGEEADEEDDDEESVTASQEAEDQEEGDDQEEADDDQEEADDDEEDDEDQEEEADEDQEDEAASVSTEAVEEDDEDDDENTDDEEDDDAGEQDQEAEPENEDDEEDENQTKSDEVTEASTEAAEDDEDAVTGSEEAIEDQSTEQTDEPEAIATSEEIDETQAEDDTPDEETTVSEEAPVDSQEEIVAESTEAVADEETSEETVVAEQVISEEAAPAGEETEAAESAEETADTEESAEEVEPLPEEDLLLEYEIPDNLRDTSHIYELLNINDEAVEKEKAIQQVADVILRDLKKTYDNAIKPLEALYKYRDLSNRHFGDPEIFSKPLVLLMGPWSGGKSTILNYLTQNEYTPNSVRTGAEPSPAYFNILMHGDEPEVLDGTQLAADWTFSGLQKFGQGLLDRLRGQKLPNKLLERVNIVEIPGILEVRKQVSQYFPFNDACQWFIDRADIIFLVYDPSKLDVGPETEAILDQLKGREYQTRIILNKADQVKPEELLRVQGALIWNISPLMSSAQPPVMYTVSLWSNPYETGAPIRLLQAQERSLLLDLGQAIDKRIENKIASARRFAVRVRNHAKMVDCYLTTYYNHKTLFTNKKHITDQIIGNPQQYHIYEGLSTLTNISRYDLPDPDVYRDFFQLNPLYEFKKLSETCTYFRGCPINKLDIAIAYDLPELVGKYKKMVEAALAKLQIPSSTTDFGRAKSSS